MPNTEHDNQTFNEAERSRLVKLFWADLAYLGALIAISLGLTIYLVNNPQNSLPIFLALIAGVLGSATAAIVSCLDRRADGFEDSQGAQVPRTKERKERFNEGMFYWFLVRPWLGAVMGAVAYWGLTGKVFGEKGDLDANLARLAFYCFIAGLLAKSLIDIFRGLLKNIFK